MTDVKATTSFEELDAALTRAHHEMVGEVPLVPNSPDVMVDLVRGLHYNGARQTRAEVRELTGVDEEALAKYRKVEETFDAVLAVGVVRLGDLHLASMPFADRQGYLRQLLVGERDMLFLKIAQVTYGDDRSFPITCKTCNREQNLEVSISEDFQPRNVEGIREGTFTFVTSKGLKLEFRPTTGADQMDVMSRDGLSAAEMNSALIAACVVSVDGGVVVDPLEFARSLPMRDRQGLLQKMIDSQPSVDLTVRVPCIGCREEQQVTFGWLDFFRTQ